MARKSKGPASRHAMVAIGLLLVMLLLGSRASEAEFSQVAVKAAFLYRFAAYAEWPGGVVGRPSFKIVLLGADDIATEPDKLLSGLVVQWLKVEVIRALRLSELESAQMVFVDPGSMPMAIPLLDSVTRRPLLVVTDSQPEFGHGAVINFLRVGPNVRFEISLSAADRRQLRIGSGLLSVAARVEGRKGADLSCAKRWGLSSLRPGCQDIRQWALIPSLEPPRIHAGA